jgi:hypothetical protein
MKIKMNANYKKAKYCLMMSLKSLMKPLITTFLPAHEFEAALITICMWSTNFTYYTGPLHMRM